MTFQLLTSTVETTMPLKSIKEILLQPRLHIGSHILLSVYHGHFFKIDPILRNKVNLNKYKKVEVPSDILSDHQGLTLGINNNNNNNNNNNRDVTNSWK